MSKVAVIGGSGLSDGFTGFDEIERVKVDTPYGETSSPLLQGTLAGREIVFLPRHGQGHTVAPHKINYRANIAALADVGVERVIAVNAVGGIGSRMGPGVIAIPDQIIDYTWGRESTFFDGVANPLQHVDFSQPYSAGLCEQLSAAASASGIACEVGGTYGCTQGPRLETAAEILRLKNDGCDLVGMTAMPEAALAREQGLEYASVCLVVNWGAGLQDEPITMEQIYACLEEGMGRVRSVIQSFLGLLDS